MNLKSVLIATAVALLGSSPLPAAPAADYIQIMRDEPVQLRPDRAYFLLRIAQKGVSPSPVFLRVPSDEELAAYDVAKRVAFKKSNGKVPFESFVFNYKGVSNLFGLNRNKFYARDADTETVLVDTRPGEYVLYGQGLNGLLYQCLCLGTVGFNAPAGTITDLGTYMTASAAKPSVFPELAGETNLGRTASMDWMLFATALRPARDADIVPPTLNREAVRRANFHAVGPFVDPNVTLINRLAAIPGVLEYRQGHVFDVKSGAEAPAR